MVGEDRLFATQMGGDGVVERTMDMLVGYSQLHYGFESG